MHRMTNNLSEKPCDFQNQPINEIYTFSHGEKVKKTFSCMDRSSLWDGHNSKIQNALKKNSRHLLRNWL